MDPIFTVSIPQLKKAFPFLLETNIGDDFFIVEDNGSALGSSHLVLDVLKHPIRFEGLLLFYCISGEFDVDLNLQTYTIRPQSMALSIPGTILRVDVDSIQNLDGLHFLCVGMSQEFITGMRVDFSRIFEDSLKFIARPCLQLNGQQIDLAMDYITLCRKVIASPIQDKKNVVGTLLSSLAYMAGDVWLRGIPSAKGVTPVQGTARTQILFERFLALVAQHHTSERGMAFYADKLCLTPKYLSKLIKQVSGRSAPDWIDSFVITEAKNMLRYSEIPIKEIVYRLNFPNQSVFYKFFKAHAGMTPSDYRNS